MVHLDSYTYHVPTYYVYIHIAYSEIFFNFRLLDAYHKLHKLAAVLSYFSTQEWSIANDNVWSLWKRLSDKDKEIFDFNLNNIDWHRYYHHHCMGIRRFILKEDPESIPYAKKKRIV